MSDSFNSYDPQKWDSLLELMGMYHKLLGYGWWIHRNEYVAFCEKWGKMYVGC